jgi:hypothetical protein
MIGERSHQIQVVLLEMSALKKQAKVPQGENRRLKN